jgi:hypothetical protein
LLNVKEVFLPICKCAETNMTYTKSEFTYAVARIHGRVIVIAGICWRGVIFISDRWHPAIFVDIAGDVVMHVAVEAA